MSIVGLLSNVLNDYYFTAINYFDSYQSISNYRLGGDSALYGVYPTHQGIQPDTFDCV